MQFLRRISKEPKGFRAFQRQLSTTKDFTYDPEIKPMLLKNRTYKDFLKTIPFPIQIGRGITTELNQPNVLSKAFYLKTFLYAASETWTKLAKDYIKALHEENFDFFEKTVEKNLVDKIRQFYAATEAGNIRLDLIEPEPEKFNTTMEKDKIVKGAFIERQLNYGDTDYMVNIRPGKETYELKPKTARIDFSKVIMLDQFLNPDDIDKDRKNYKKNQYLIEIQTNLKLILVKKHGDEIVYGNDDFDNFETHYMQVENRRDFFQTTPYVITDFDFILAGNPHIKKTVM